MEGTQIPHYGLAKITQAARYIIAGEQPNSIFTPEKYKGALLAPWLDATESETAHNEPEAPASIHPTSLA